MSDRWIDAIVFGISVGGCIAVAFWFVPGAMRPKRSERTSSMFFAFTGGTIVMMVLIGYGLESMRAQ